MESTQSAYGGCEVIKIAYCGPLETMSVTELRIVLIPYGTMHRSTMKKKQLIETIRQIEKNEEQYGQPERPLGIYRDKS